MLPTTLCDCLVADCSVHRDILDSYAQKIISCVLDCAHLCFPTYRKSSTHRLVGWKNTAYIYKHSANFWHKLWDECGCPSSGVLFQLKKKTKSRYKYEVRRLKRRQKSLLQMKFVSSFTKKNKSEFWSDVHQLNRSYSNSTSTVDGASNSKSIADIFASKFDSLLNTHSSSLHDSIHSFIQASMNSDDLIDVHFSDVEVLQAISKLKSHKSDCGGVCSEHLKLAAPAISNSLATFFTSVVKHGYMPHCLRDCILVPISKGNKDPSCSQNYRAIALGSSLSKVLEHLIINKYSSYLATSSLQFGFKSSSSTTLCTGVVKNVVSHYIHRGSSVLGCFLDASKAFDLVNHGILFQKLLDRGLPLPVIRFLSSWYRAQKMRVRWNNSLSIPFGVSNGVRQGSVLSPILFSVYLDDLLEKLRASGVGCYLGGCFAGALSYADDIVLLAPCASSLRCMLGICQSFASSHGLIFNASKTQTICFRLSQMSRFTPSIFFDNTKLMFVDEVSHLGHILTYNLNDKQDIIRVVKDMNRKANSILCKFSALDCAIKCYLIKSYCLSLYGSALWSLGSPSIKIIEISLNKILRKVWNLPRMSHTRIVHCIAGIPSILHLVYSRFCSLF